MTIERSWVWRGHPLHFTVEKTEAKREEEKLFIMSQTEFSSSPLNPTLTSVSRIIIWLFASARNPGVTLGSSFNHPIPSIHQQIIFSLLSNVVQVWLPYTPRSCPTLGQVHPPLLSKLCRYFLICPLYPLLPHPPIPPESPPHTSQNGLFHVSITPCVSPALILPTAPFHSEKTWNSLPQLTRPTWSASLVSALAHYRSSLLCARNRAPILLSSSFLPQGLYTCLPLCSEIPCPTCGHNPLLPVQSNR